MTRKGFVWEPVTIMAALQAILTMLVGFDALTWAGLNGTDSVVLVMAVANAVAAVVIAYRTDRTLLAPVVELFKALVAAGVIYGWNLGEEKSALVVATITAVFAMFHQSQVTALPRGNFALAA